MVISMSASINTEVADYFFPDIRRTILKLVDLGIPVKISPEGLTTKYTGGTRGFHATGPLGGRAADVSLYHFLVYVEPRESCCHPRDCCKMRTCRRTSKRWQKKDEISTRLERWGLEDHHGTLFSFTSNDGGRSVLSKLTSTEMPFSNPISGRRAPAANEPRSVCLYKLSSINPTLSNTITGSLYIITVFGNRPETIWQRRITSDPTQFTRVHRVIEMVEVGSSMKNESWPSAEDAIKLIWSRHHLLGQLKSLKNWETLCLLTNCTTTRSDKRQFGKYQRSVGKIRFWVGTDLRPPRISRRRTEENP